MFLIPPARPLTNPARPIFSEEDVSTPTGFLAPPNAGGLKVNDAYDLILYPDHQDPRRGVLVVRMVLQFQFKDGKSTADATRGQPLTWTQQEKADFARYFKEACLDVWNHKHRLTTDSTVPAVREVTVTFDIKTLVDGLHLNDHWELSVTKVDGFTKSSVDVLFGNSKIDSRDINFAEKSAHQYQRGAAHELGHMLGLRDEYPDAKENPHWFPDVASVMHSGESVRPRHYAPFAYWLTWKYAPLAILKRQKILFKVNGTIDLHNALL